MQFNNLSVVEFNNIVKNIFDAEEMLYNCAVIGEISAFKITNNVAYFTIKDEYAVLNCVWFSPALQFKIGDKVKVIGRPNYYVKGGKLNFNVTAVESFGEGEIFKKFLLLKEKLKNEGYFYNKKELPENISNIGVVTSSKGAVIKDIISVATRRNPNINIFIYSVKVQGVDSDKEIAKGIDFFGSYDVDCIIVARGGGSSEDLDAFNSEIVAQSCFKCVKPIISAVGHETDYTLIDLVADIRASTPSVAAEIAVKESKNYIFDLTNLNYKLNNIMKNNIYKMHNTMHSYANSINFSINKILNNMSSRFKLLVGGVTSEMENRSNVAKNMSETLYYKLINVNPLSYLEKGYAIITKNAKKQNNINQINVGDNIEIFMKEGKLQAKVEKKEKV